MVRDAWRRFHDLVVRLEELPWGPGRTLALLAGIVAVRNLLEITVARNPVFPGLAAFVHYPLAYVAPALALALLLAALAGLAPARVARLMVLAWLLTLAPPVLDLLLHPAREAPTIAYLQADPADLPWTLVHFFDPRVSLPGTTAGIRLETLAAVLLGSLYVGMRSGRWWRALVAAPAVYAVSLFFFSLPVIAYGACRLVLPSLTRDSFAHGEGILFRPDAANGLDPLAISWLVPLLLLLGVPFTRIERRHAERWFPAPVKGYGNVEDGPTIGGVAPLVMGFAAAGLAAGVLLWFPGGAAPPVVPWDLAGSASLLLAVPLLLAGVRHLALGQPTRGTILLGLGCALGAALGTAPAVGLAASSGAMLPAMAGVLPRRGLARWAGIAAGTSVSALAAFAAGFALVIGPEGMARIPREILPFLLAWGLLAGLLSEAGASMAPRAGLRPVVPAVLGVATVLLVLGTLSMPEIRADLRHETREVGRLARIRGERDLREGRLDSARTWLRAAIRANPRDADAHRQLGLLYVRKGRLDRALQEFRAAVELAPDDPANIANLASALLQEGRPAEALELLDRAVQLAPRDLVVLFNRARALEETGRKAEAAAAWQAYLKLAAPRPEEAKSVREARRRLRRLRATTQ